MSDIVIGKLAKHSFSSDMGDFHIYRARANGGEWFSVTYKGEDPPKARKTVQVVMFGKWVKHAKYGKQLELSRLERYEPLTSEKIADGEIRRTLEAIVGSERNDIEKRLDAEFVRMAKEHKQRYPTFAYGDSFVEWAQSRPLSHKIELAQSDGSVVMWNKSRQMLSAAKD